MSGRSKIKAAKNKKNIRSRIKDSAHGEAVSEQSILWDIAFPGNNHLFTFPETHLSIV